MKVKVTLSDLQNCLLYYRNNKKNYYELLWKVPFFARQGISANEENKFRSIEMVLRKNIQELIESFYNEANNSIIPQITKLIEDVKNMSDKEVKSLKMDSDKLIYIVHERDRIQLVYHLLDSYLEESELEDNLCRELGAKLYSVRDRIENEFDIEVFKRKGLPTAIRIAGGKMTKPIDFDEDFFWWLDSDESKHMPVHIYYKMMM